jgi:hypothetical protein
MSPFSAPFSGAPQSERPLLPRRSRLHSGRDPRRCDLNHRLAISEASVGRSSAVSPVIRTPSERHFGSLEHRLAGRTESEASPHGLEPQPTRLLTGKAFRRISVRAYIYART